MNNPYDPMEALRNRQMLMHPRMTIPKVNGYEGAMAFDMGPESSVLLMDLNDPIVWCVVTDSSGFKTATPLEVKIKEMPKPVTVNDLSAALVQINDRLGKLEERMTVNAQSNNVPSWNGKSGNANSRPNDRNGQNGQGPSGGDHANGAK